MPLSRQDIEGIIAKELPGFTIVDQPISDAPDFFAKPEANTPDLDALKAKLGGGTSAAPSAPASSPIADDITTIPVRSPENPLQPATGSQLKYVVISNKTGKIVAIQG